MFKLFKAFIIYIFTALSCINFAIANNDKFQIQEMNLDFNLKDRAIKLNNGNILFGISAIFNPKENKFYKTKFYDTNKKFDTKIKLKNDNILLINSYKSADKHFYSNIYNLIKYDFETKYYDIYYPSKKFSSQYYKHNKIKNPKIETEFHNYWENEYISAKNKEKLYLPHLKKNPQLYEEYQKYIKLLDESSYAYIYKPLTDELIIAGKRQIKDKITDYQVLNDGRVLLVYSPHNENFSKYEVFNPKTEEFTQVENVENLYKTSHKYFNYKDSLNLNPKNHYEYIKNENYFYIIENNKTVLKVNQDDATPSYKKIGTLHIARHEPKYIILKSGNLFLYVGRKYYIDGSSNPDYRAEFFDVKSGKSKIIDNFEKLYDEYSFILLDDGRVLFYTFAGNKVFLLS